MRFSQQKFLFGDPASAISGRANYVGGAGGAVFWSEPVDISRHDGSSMWLTAIASGGGAGCQIDIFSFGTGDSTNKDLGPANDGRAYGYVNQITTTMTAGGETVYGGVILPSTKRQSRWARAKLTVAATFTLSLYAQLDVREDL